MMRVGRAESTDLEHDLAGLDRLGLGVDLGERLINKTNDDAGDHQAELTTELRASDVPKLMRVPAALTLPRDEFLPLLRREPGPPFPHRLTLGRAERFRREQRLVAGPGDESADPRLRHRTDGLILASFTTPAPQLGDRLKRVARFAGYQLVFDTSAEQRLDARDVLVHRRAAQSLTDRILHGGSPLPRSYKAPMGNTTENRRALDSRRGRLPNLRLNDEIEAASFAAEETENGEWVAYELNSRSVEQ